MNVTMHKNVVRGYINIRCDRSALIRSFNFCSTRFYELRESIENDINIINESITNITQSMNMIQPTPEAAIIYENILHEAISDRTNLVEKHNKMSFVDTDGSKSNPGEKTSQSQNSFINQIVNYMKISTNLISAKMKVLAKMYKSHLDIVSHYVDIIQYGDPVPNNQVQKVDTKTT